MEIGKLVITTCIQGMGAPFIDESTTYLVNGERVTSRAILLTPWKRNKYGEAMQQLALVIGWRS